MLPPLASHAWAVMAGRDDAPSLGGNEDGVGSVLGGASGAGC